MPCFCTFHEKNSKKAGGRRAARLFIGSGAERFARAYIYWY